MLARLFASSDEVASDPSVEGCEPVSCEMVSCVNFPLDPFSSGVTDDEHADDARPLRPQQRREARQVARRALPGVDENLTGRLKSPLNAKYARDGA